MIFARWIKNQQGRLVCVWSLSEEAQSLSDAVSEPAEQRGGHIVLAWVNPNICDVRVTSDLLQRIAS